MRSLAARAANLNPMPPDLIRKPVHYDRAVRRLWIRGQRCHHGATGAVLATVGAFVMAAGGVLMAHDWKDRPLWFVRGWQDQP